jgi:hypothetical protein
MFGPRSLMELSPSWEAANCAAIQELDSILRNPKDHYHAHKTPSLVHILSQINPIHTFRSDLSKIHSNIIHLPTSWSSQWSLSFWLSHHYHGMSRCQVADGGDALRVWRVATNILNKQSRTTDKGPSSRLGVGRGANNPSP